MIINTESHDEWETPDKLFEELNKEFNFNMDLACTSKNCKTKFGCMINLDKSGLDYSVGWNSMPLSIYCNPPYARGIKDKFIKKCYELSKQFKVNQVVMLIPVATSTKTFHKYVLPHAEIRFLKGRPKFKSRNNKGEYVTNKLGTRDCMIVIFKKLADKTL